MDIGKITTTDWVAIYGAILSTVIAVVSSFKYILKIIDKKKERDKFETDLYLLRKIDRSTKEIHPIVVVLLANLGKERMSLKSLEYDGIAENNLKTSGCMGWYEQPEEAYGIRKRLLPIVLESGQTADLPMISIGVITMTKNIRIWLTNFDGRRIYISEKDVIKVRHDIEKFLLEQKKTT